MKRTGKSDSLQRLAAAGALAGLMAACGGHSGGAGDNGPPAGGEGPQATAFEVDIRRTTGGVPHVKGADLASVGYGLGYVWAQDHACTMSGRWLTTGAEVAARFGKDGPGFPFDNRNGNLASDLYLQKLFDEKWLDGLLADAGPTGVLPEIRELVRGYTAGYNRYLKEVNLRLDDPRCAGADWLRPITERDVYVNATLWADALTAVRNEFAGFLAAVPPGVPSLAIHEEAARLASLPPPRVTASNMVALGREATRSGNGMLFSNPHWEWNAADGMVAAHMTVPGKLNVNGMTYGASPVIGIGHNDRVAWGATSAGATVSNGVRYRLQLVPGSPTSYLVDGARHEMVATTVTVQLKDESGQVVPFSHTYYETRFGTVTVAANRPWTETEAHTWKHSPLKVSGLNMWYLYAQSKGVDDIHAADRATMGVAWINSMAADVSGRAYRSMPNPLPNVTDAMFADCRDADGVLDGSRSACAPLEDPSAPFPGVFPASAFPHQFRDDYTFNANDSYWITNLRAPLEGYPSMFGRERVALSHRSRAGLEIIEQRLAGSDGLTGQGFTLESFIGQTFDGREFARIWQPELTGYCRELVGQSGAPMALEEACDAIEGWGGSYLLDDPGAVLYRRFVERSGTGVERYTVPFDPVDPLGTPRGLARSDAVRDALYGAVNDLVDNGIRLDASLRPYQYRLVGDERIPLPGGNIFQRLNTTAFDGANGWRALSGSSFVYWVEMTPAGPVGKQIQVQGQSDNPLSPWHAEQTRRYSEGRYLDILFSEEAILADPGLTSMTLREKVDGSF